MHRQDLQSRHGSPSSAGDRQASYMHDMHVVLAVQTCVSAQRRRAGTGIPERESHACSELKQTAGLTC